MAIAEQFAGLRMDELIGGPLRAAADAGSQLAQSTAAFIQNVGFENSGKVRTITFGYQQHSVNEDGTSNLDEMKVDIPLLAIVPIPNLQVDEVNILFDMEVKQSEREESQLDVGGALTGSLQLGLPKINVTGNVSAHKSNTRSSDNSAKYHVDVHAANHGVSEGLARVLDIMAVNVTPMLVGSSLKDGNGQTLSAQARMKAERLKALRQEISIIKTRLNAARDGLENNIGQLRSLGSKQQNIFQGSMFKLINETHDTGLAAGYFQTMDTVNQSWNTFKDQAAELVKLIADMGEAEGGVSKLFALQALDATGQAVPYTAGQYYSAIETAQNKAVESRKLLDDIEEELARKKAEYSGAAAGKYSGGIAAGEENQEVDEEENQEVTESSLWKESAYERDEQE